MVVGVDRSAELIRIAEERGRAPHVRYLTDEAEALGSLADASFDGATCCLALTDIDHLSGADCNVESAQAAAGHDPAARVFTGPRGGRITTAVLRDATHWERS